MPLGPDPTMIWIAPGSQMFGATRVPWIWVVEYKSRPPIRGTAQTLGDAITAVTEAVRSALA